MYNRKESSDPTDNFFEVSLTEDSIVDLNSSHNGELEYGVT
jgi:hypothetical protein